MIKATDIHKSYGALEVLRGVSLEVSRGEVVSIVGASGAGKTTVFQLLLRFYDAGEGRIEIDGVPVRETSLEALRQRIGIVPQDPVIFSSSALDNIRYGRPDATDAQVKAAADAAKNALRLRLILAAALVIG